MMHPSWLSRESKCLLVFGMQRRQLSIQQGRSSAACADESPVLEQLNSPLDSRRNSFGQCLASGGGRRTTWRRFGGSCPMTSRFSRRSITSCSSHNPFAHAHLALRVSLPKGDMYHAQAWRSRECCNEDQGVLQHIQAWLGRKNKSQNSHTA